ncbi:hypothetical protein MSIMFB_05107 [Mycobacterium simulans]|uniref:Phage integrase family protein n=1 Tax=Mycobacterium simulans TaxID=627089 RepID=A0A7Z7IPU5_9MYCO|nr:hypothetical protein MSIMFB_05107 [Mycobacterium simulans]
MALFLRELLAAGRSAATLRSFGMDLLRWWRFLRAVDVCWARASRVEARDFSCWIRLTVKQQRPAASSGGAVWTSGIAGAPNSITGKPALRDGYAAPTVAHSETVLRGFYDFHRDTGTGPILNPFPLDPSRRSRRAHAHRNPMDGWARERVGALPADGAAADSPSSSRSAVQRAVRSTRVEPDRALVAIWISTGVRAAELLGVRVRYRSGPATDHRGAQGNPRTSAGSRVSGCVRVAAVVSGGAARPDSRRTHPACVLEAAAITTTVELPCGASDVRARQRRAQLGLEAAQPPGGSRRPPRWLTWMLRSPWRWLWRCAASSRSRSCCTRITAASTHLSTARAVRP